MLCVGALFITHTSRAQWVVTDPTNLAQGIINATSTEAIPDLLRAAAAEGADRLVVRVSYFSTDRAGVEQMVRDVQEEKDGGRDAGMLAAPWQVTFYPHTDEPGIVEITLK